MYSSQEEFIQDLDRAGELIRIKEFVDPHLEIAEIVDRVSKSNLNSNGGGGYALLFENTGTPFPILINAMGSEKRMCMALGVKNFDDVAKNIENLFHTITSPKHTLIDKLKVLPQLSKISSWMPKEKKGRGECQEVIMEDADITKLPVMKCWPHDGGNFLTLPIIHTLDPNSGIRNVGLYRMQVFGPKLTALHWHKHKVSAGHFNEYKKQGKRMPVVVALGGDPIYVFTAACPLPPNVDEYMFAGFLRKKKVELVKCLTQEMYVPADVDIVIEGYVDPNEDFILEGPFGDHTGYYSLADYYPKFHITCITHKKNAIYPATIVGIPPQEDAWIGKAIERIFLAPIKMTLLPEIIDMEMPVEGVFHNLVIVKINNEYEGQTQKVMSAMWGAGQMMFNKILVIVDGAINIHNYDEVAKSISNNVDVASDIYFSQGPLDVLDHACSKFAFGGKMCFDATRKPDRVASSLSIESSIDNGLADTLMKLFGEIKGVNCNLLQLGISTIFISVEKNRKHHIKELNDTLIEFFKQSASSLPKFFIYVEHTINVFEIKDTLWRFANNFDPKRDSFISASSICFDGTRKTKELDDFQRPWPNVICADKKTINSVDEKWESLNIGSFISSPSIKYSKMLYKAGAVIED